MLKIYPPATILNTWVAIGIFLLVSASLYDSHPVLVTILLGLIIGVRLGAWWQDEHEQWTKSIWKYYQDGSWISERARQCYAMRTEALKHWLVSLALYSLFAVFTLGLGGLWLKFGLIEMGGFAKETGLGLWLAIPGALLVGVITAVGFVMPFILFGKLIDNPNGYLGKGQVLLKKYKNIDTDELSKLTEYEDERKRWILLGKSLESTTIDEKTKEES